MLGARGHGPEHRLTTYEALMVTITAHQPDDGIIRLLDGRQPIADLTPAQARRLQAQLTSLLNDTREPAPHLRLLGPVELTGAHGRPPQAPARALELVVFLALHPWPTSEPLDEALWPGQRVTAGKRNGPVNQARRWLGDSADGHPWLCHIDQGGYALAPEVRTDWHEARDMAARGDQDGLQRALSLVAGQPLTGVNPARYAWAEADRQEMITTLATAAQTLGRQAMSSGDVRAAAWAAAKGTMVDPGSEDLWSLAVAAASRGGDPRRVAALEVQRDAALRPLTPTGREG